MLLFAPEVLERAKRGNNNRWESWWEEDAQNQLEPQDAQQQEPSAGFSSCLPDAGGSFMPSSLKWAGTLCFAERK